MREHSPRSKVATYHMWPDGARFATSGRLAWRIENEGAGDGAFDAGDDVDATFGCRTNEMRIAGLFAKVGSDCPVASFGEPPLGCCYMLEALSDAAEVDFPPNLLARPVGRRLEADIERTAPLADGFFPGTVVATPTGERRVEDVAIGDPVPFRDAEPVPAALAESPAHGRRRPVREKRGYLRTIFSRLDSADRFMPRSIASGDFGRGKPNSDLVLATGHAALADGVFREAEAHVDRTTVTCIPPSEPGDGCAVNQLEADAGGIIQINGVPAETFADAVQYRAGSDRRRIAGELRRFTDVEGTALPRASDASRRSTRNGAGPGIGAEVESAIRSPRQIAKKPAAPSNGHPEERDRRERAIALCREEKIMKKLVHHGLRAVGPSSEMGRVGRALARIVRAGAGLFLLGATLAASHLAFAPAANAKVTISEATFPENSGTAWLILGNQGGEPTVITYETKDGTANKGTDYESVSGSSAEPVVDGRWTLVGIPIVDDTVWEGQEHFFLVVNGTDHRITIEDNESPPSVTLTLEETTVDEAAGQISATANLSISSAFTVSVNYEIVGGEAGQSGKATEGSDYQASSYSGKLTFAPGTTSQQILVEILNDNVYEGNETFKISLSQPSGAVLGSTPSKTITIGDEDDRPTLTLTLVSGGMVNEGDQASVRIKATLSEVSGANASFELDTHDGTGGARGTNAKAVSDFRPLRWEEVADRTFSIEAGLTEKEFDVLIDTVEDDRHEAQEKFFIVPLAPKGAKIGDPHRVQVDIVDDDDEPWVELLFTRNDPMVVGGKARADEGDIMSLNAYVRGPRNDQFILKYDIVEGTATGYEQFNDDNIPPGTDYYSGCSSTDRNCDGLDGEYAFRMNPNPDNLFWDINLGIASLHDNIYEGDETFTYEITLMDGNRNVLFQDDVEVTITDRTAAPSLTLTADPVRVDEGAGQGTVTATATLTNSRPGMDMTVDLASADGTATLADGDYTASTATLTIAAGATSQTGSIAIPIVDDAVDEPEETASVIGTLRGLDDAVLGTSTVANALTIIDNDDPPKVTLAPTMVDEDAGEVEFTATLVGETAKDVTVEWSVGAVGDEAKVGEDYTEANGTLNFTAAEPNRTLTIEILNDELDEYDESFSVAFASADGTATPSSSTVTIVDDEVSPTVSLSPAMANESDGAVSFKATLSEAASGREVKVEYSTTDGTAKEGTNYLASSGTLEFLIGTAEKTFSVEILDDQLDEDDETFSIHVASASGTAVVPAESHAVTIEDNDPLPALTLAVDPETVAEDGDKVVATVALSPASGRSVTVILGTADGTAMAGPNGDYAALTSRTLTFGPGESLAQDVDIAIKEDSLDEDSETFTVSLSGQTNAVLGTSFSKTVTIEDNDPLPTLTLDLDPARVAENGGPVVATVTLNSASERVVAVDIATSDGTAVAGEDYTALASRTLTFVAGGPSSQEVEIEITDDAAYEEDETFAVTLSGESNASLATSEATATIENDDELPTVTLASIAPTGVSEDGGSQTIAVTARLDVANVARDVTVVLDAVDGTAKVADGDYDDPAAVTLTIPKGRKSATQDIEVTIKPDDVYEGAETFDIELSSPTGASLGTAISGTVTINDGESLPVVTLESISPVSVSEDVGTQRFAVTAQIDVANAAGAVTVAVDAADGTATAGEDFEYPVAVTLTIPKGLKSTTESFDVAIKPDDVHEGPETFEIELSAPTGASLGAIVSKSVTITDPTPSVTLMVDKSRVFEGDTVVATAILRAGNEKDVTVNYSTEDGTASADEDYEKAFGTLTFAPGQTHRTFEIEIFDDASLETEDESFSVYLREPGPDVEMGVPFRQSVTIAGEANPLSEGISEHLSDRTVAVLEDQPRLIPFLRNPGSGPSREFAMSVDGYGLRAEGGAASDGFWGDAAGSWTNGDDVDGRHFQSAAGVHRRLSDNLLLGGMLQYHATGAELYGSALEIRSRGWMLGPYLVARHGSLPVFYEGRLLYGRNENDVEHARFDGSFHSTLWIAQARIEGVRRFDNGVSMIPLIDLGHVREEAKGFRDDMGTLVPDLAATATRLQVGAEFEIPVAVRRGDMALKLGFGLSGTHTGRGSGENPNSGFRGRIGFGANYRMENRTSLAFETYYSGIGRSGRRRLGAGLTFLLRF